MMTPADLGIIVGAALARWTAMYGVSESPPLSWLLSLHEMVSGYYVRLVEWGQFDHPVFEEDVFRLVCSLASPFLPRAAVPT